MVCGNYQTICCQVPHTLHISTNISYVFWVLHIQPVFLFVPIDIHVKTRRQQSTRKMDGAENKLDTIQRSIWRTSRLSPECCNQLCFLSIDVQEENTNARQHKQAVVRQGGWSSNNRDINGQLKEPLPSRPIVRKYYGSQVSCCCVRRLIRKMSVVAKLVFLPAFYETLRFAYHLVPYRWNNNQKTTKVAHDPWPIWTPFIENLRALQQ